MDTSEEARVNPLATSPSTIKGRSIAFRVFFCNILHLRGWILHVLWNFLRRFKDSSIQLISWFHPRKPQGIIVMASAIAFLLMRYRRVGSQAESARRKKFWRNMMGNAVTYAEWFRAAKMLDKETPKIKEGELYDEELVRTKLQELRNRRREGCLRDIVFYMRADLVRNLGNMCNPQLHKGRLQVPKLIKEYINEVSSQLRMVCNFDSEELLLEEKLAFMHETRHAFGRTALLLSGGASMGAFHVGAVDTLVKNKLLPRIIAGSSVGSIMCAIAATWSSPELESFFSNNLHYLEFFDQMGGIFAVAKRVMTQGAIHDIRQLQRLLRNMTSNLTFQEAHDITGRILCITVCSSREHEPSRCLNYLTSPHVVIWSAVTASCAFPGLFEAQELMAKDIKGEIVPFHAPFLEGSGEFSGNSMCRWRDGSLESDLPMVQLKELFNVNHFIVSQANPHIVPFLRLKELARAYGGSFAAKIAHLAEMEVKYRCNQALALGFPFGGLAKMLVQEWEGDVTVVMPATLAQYLKLWQSPSHLDLQKAARQGRRCTWEKLSAIKANCGIELVLDECVSFLHQIRRLKRNAERLAASNGQPTTAWFSAVKGIPSWNCGTQENSTSSLEELQDGMASFHDGSSYIGRPSGLKFHQLFYDGSDSESETADLNSWAMSGGPLLTSSAKELLQSFEFDDISNKPGTCEEVIQHASVDENDGLTCS